VFTSALKMLHLSLNMEDKGAHSYAHEIVFELAFSGIGIVCYV